MKKIATLLILFLGLANCSSLKTEADYPGTQEEQRREKYGRLTGEGGLLLFKGNRQNKTDEGGVSGIAINSYLWRATLDTISFMPLASADPFGGVIITDWFEDPDTPGERFKVNVVITSKDLRSDSVKVTVFKKKFHKTRGWQDARVNSKVARDLENKILTRARKLRVGKK